MSQEIINPLDYCRSTIQLKETIETSFIALGERLARIRQGNLWEQEWGSWEEYVMELKMSPATASKLINVYETFVVKFQLPHDKLGATGWASLYEVLPLCTSKEKAEEMVEKATVLKRDDLRDEIREATKGVCSHTNGHTITLRICDDCGKKIRVYEENTD